MGVRFDATALDDLGQKFTEAEEITARLAGSQAAQSTMKKGLDIIANDARARVHSITGTLHDSIRSYVKVAADTETVMEVGVSYARSKAKYAHLVEGGHGGPHGPAKPHPFWEPAVEATAEEAVAVVQDAMMDLLGEIF